MERKDSHLTLVNTAYGTIVIDPKRDQKMARLLSLGGYPNEELLDIVRALVPFGGIAVDAGAHIGTFAIAMSSFFRAVVAFEPVPATYTVLQKNVRAHENIEVRHKGLGSQTSHAHVQERNATNAGSQTLISGGDLPVVRLDDELSQADFIKIDVEGMELEMLEGASRLIQTSRPVVLFEVNLSQLRAHGASVSALQRFFSARGYRLLLPVFREHRALALVRSLTLLTICIAPRACLLRVESAPFDLFAVPEENQLPFPTVGFMRAIRHVVSCNLAIKVRRLGIFLRGTF